MIRPWSIAVTAALIALAGCAVSPPEPATEVAVATDETFAGRWQSITPSLEFVGLLVAPKSSQAGVLATRLMFSGVYWEGNGRVSGDSLIADVGMAGATPPTGVLVGHVGSDGKLNLRLRSSNAAPLDLTFVRDP
jgi:hypothetical protein